MVEDRENTRGSGERQESIQTVEDRRNAGDCEMNTYIWLWIFLTVMLFSIGL